jgi:hypothetical protein
MAYDGGFGTLPNNCGPEEQPSACFGDKRFNTPSLIEAADTGPYYHNNVAGTLEEAIAVYNQPAFNTSPGAFTSSGADRTVVLDPESVNAVGSFLRTINALENIRSSNKLDDQARQLEDEAAREMLHLAEAETRDALEVLRGSAQAIYPDAAVLLARAARLENQAQRWQLSGWWRNSLIRYAIQLKTRARAQMVNG